MNKLSLYFLLLLIGFSIPSCKKDDPSFSGAKVLNSYNLIAGYVDAYAYNTDGNVSLIQRNTGNKTVFVYPGDSISRQSINAASVLTSVTNYFLHGQKYADASYGQLQAQNSSSTY